MERIDLTAFSQLVQDFISGAVRRTTFTPLEMNLLLDFQRCRIRKSARANVLRRYLRAAQKELAIDASNPLKLSDFLQREQRQRLCRSSVETRAAAAFGN